MADVNVGLGFNEIDKLIASLKQIRQGVNGVNDSVEEVNKSVDELNTELLEQKDVIKDIQAEEKRLSKEQKKGTKDYSKELKRVRGDLIVAKKEQQKITEQINKTVRAQKASAKQADRTAASFKKLAAAVGLAFGIREVIRFGKELNRVAIESEAFRNRAKVVFGDSLRIIENFADESAIALGFTKNQFLGAAAAIGDILVPLGLTRQRAAELSTEAVRLGTAIKRFSGDQRDASEISQIVARSFTGEVEALKGLGIVVQQNSKEFKELVKQKQRDEGASLGQAKALAIYETVVSSAADALTNLDQSTDSLQAQNERLNAQVLQLQENLSERLTPALLLLTEAWNDFLEGVDATDKVVNQLIASTRETVDEAKSAQEAFDSIVERRKLQEELISDFQAEIAQERKRKKRKELFEDLDIEKQFLEELLALEQEFANKVIEERNRVSEEGDETAKEQIRNIAFLQEEIKKLTKANAEDLTLTRAQNIANTQKINALRQELKALTEINKAKVENIELTKQQIKDIDVEASNTDDKIVELLTKFEEIQKQSQDVQTANYKGFTEGILELAQGTTEGIIELTKQEQQARIEAAAVALFGVTRLLTALAGEQQKYAGFVKAINLVEIIANGALALSNALATTSAPTADNVATGGISGLVKYATISGIVLSTIAEAITSIRSSPIPQFAEGVPFLEGPGTSTSDSIPAFLSRGERVTDARTNQEYWEPLEAIRTHRFDNEYFDKKGVQEILMRHEMKKETSFADNIANSLALMGEVDNHDHFIRLRRHGGNTVHYLRSIDKKLDNKSKKLR